MLSFEIENKVHFFFDNKMKQTSIANLLSKNPESTTDSTANGNVEGTLEFIAHSKVTDNILFFISGYIIGNLAKKLIARLCNINGATQIN